MRLRCVICWSASFGVLVRVMVSHIIFEVVVDEYEDFGGAIFCPWSRPPEGNPCAFSIYTKSNYFHLFSWEALLTALLQNPIDSYAATGEKMDPLPSVWVLTPCLILLSSSVS